MIQRITLHKIAIILAVSLLSVAREPFAQVVIRTTSCTSITGSVVSNLPSYRADAFRSPVNSVQKPNGGQCNIINHSTEGTIIGPVFQLQRRSSGSSAFSNYRDRSGSLNFKDLPAGQYRVITILPGDVVTSKCPNQPQGVKVYNTSGQYLGIWSSHDAPFGRTVHTSNTIPVGESPSSANNYKFFDNTKVPNNNFFPYGSMVTMDARASDLHDSYFLAIFEQGGKGRYRRLGSGWTKGRASTFNLSEIWDGGDGWNFEPYTQYSVQFVIGNNNCTGWNVKDQVFSICPAGGNCAIAFDLPGDDLKVFPNPAIDKISIAGKFTDQDFPLAITIVDVAGREMLTKKFYGDDIDTSMLPVGMYTVHIKSSNPNFVVPAKQLLIQR